jgi:hypothetical protein
MLKNEQYLYHMTLYTGTYGRMAMSLLYGHDPMAMEVTWEDVSPWIQWLL